MRKLITAIVLAVVATTSFAQHGVRDIRNGTYHYGGHSHIHHSNRDWVGPLIIGGVIGAVIASQNQQPVIIHQPQVIVQPPVYTPIYRNVEVYIAECNCYRVVTVQIN